MARKVLATFVDDDGCLLVETPDEVSLALAAIVITQSLAKMADTYGVEVAAAAGVLRKALCEASGPPTVIARRRQPGDRE